MSPAPLLPATGIGAGVTAARTPREVATSVDELLSDAQDRRPMHANTHSLSSASFERVTIHGEPFVVKHLHPDDDWVMRATAELACRSVHLWRSGLFDLLPASIDPTIAGAAAGYGRNGWGAALLLRDVGDAFMTEGDDVIEGDEHVQFIEHMADLHVQFWGYTEDDRLTPRANRWFILSPDVAEAERHARNPADIPRMAGEGWRALANVSPDAAELALALFADITPLIAALDATPSTLVHGDWKLGNLGVHDDGRTVLVDWAFPGAGPPCADLAWYLGVNCARLPESKEDAIDRYRDALEARGVDTTAWWEEQLALSLLGNFLQFGWNKQMAGRDAEFLWWEERVLDARQYL